MERPPFETDEATEGIEDEVGIVEEAVEDGNRSPDSIIVINVVNLVTSLLRNLYFRTESCGGWDFCLPQMVQGCDCCYSYFFETPAPSSSYYFFQEKYRVGVEVRPVTRKAL